jgi:octaprenyl-diphosphate synthase
VLDIIGDEEKIGKTLGTDFVETKPTLPLIHLLENSDVKQKNEIIGLVDNNELKEVAKLLTENGSVEFSQQTVGRYVARATESLASLPDSPAKFALLDTANFIAARADR